ncbi:hypothetical protein Droror1_Dr00021537, partial [Drosera rotundifolia]
MTEWVPRRRRGRKTGLARRMSERRTERMKEGERERGKEMMRENLGILGIRPEFGRIWNKFGGVGCATWMARINSIG